MIRTVIFYDTALCNLQCKYCYISKNPGLLGVDEELEKSFADPDYYINLLKEYVAEEDIIHIERIEIWGAETLLKLDRIFPVLEQIINLSQDFYAIFLSSNFAHDKVIPNLLNLVKFLSQFKNRKFDITVQISCDGPKDINDFNRGLGVTDKIIDNINELLSHNELLNSSQFQFHYHAKPTLDRDNLQKLLDPEYNIYYYQFFENNLIDPFVKKGQYFKPSLPNLCTPAEYTQEDGFLLRDVTKMQRQVERDNIDKKYFQYYKNITLFSQRINENKRGYCANNFCCDNPFCGTGVVSIGLLPNNMICGCHRSFAEYYEKYNLYYSEWQKDSLIYPFKDFLNINHLIFKTPEEWKKFSQSMSYYRGCTAPHKQSTAFISTNVNQLMFLSQCGLVDEKYKNLDEAITGVRQVRMLVSGCLADNLILTKISSAYPSFQLKLFCNGALDYICNNEKGDNNDDLSRRN